MCEETRKYIKKHKLEVPVQYNHKTMRKRADISTEAPKIRKALKKCILVFMYNNHKYRLLHSGKISFIIETERKV